MSDQISIGRYLAKRILSAGVNTVFTVPGDFIFNLLDEFQEEGLHLITCCNELNAGYAADGYARASGKIAVLLVTYMVGALSAINSIAGAYSEDIPILIIVGAPNSHEIQRNRIIHHCVHDNCPDECAKCFEPIVEEIFKVQSNCNAEGIIDKAFSLCFFNKKPVYLEISCNVVSNPVRFPYQVNFSEFESFANSNIVCFNDAVDYLKLKIIESTKVLVIIGVYVVVYEAQKEISTFLDETRCHYAVLPDAKGAVNEESSQFIGTFWGNGFSSNYIQKVIDESDLIIFIGSRFSDNTSIGWEMNIPSLKSIFINKNSIIDSKSYFPYVDLKDVVSYLCENPIEKLWEVDRNEIPEEPKENTFRGEIDCIIQEGLEAYDAVICDSGDSWFIAQNLQLKENTKFLTQMQYCSIGWSLGASLGVGLSGSSTNFLTLIGDGAIQMVFQELSTILKNNVKGTIFVLNNASYAIENQIHQGGYNQIVDWNYTDLIEAFAFESSKFRAAKVTNSEELKDAFKQAKTFNGLYFIECVVEKDSTSEKLKVWGKKISNLNNNDK